MDINTGIAGDTVDLTSKDLFFLTTITKDHLPDILGPSSGLLLQHESATVSNTQHISEGRGNHPVTVFTVNHQGVNKPSVTFIAPTITTNSLPTGLSNATFPYSFPLRNTSYDTTSSQYTYSNSTHVSVYSDDDFISPKSTLTSLSERTKSSTSSTSTSSKTSTTSTSFDTSESIGTVTITEYLEEVTYTQAYVITDSRTTFSTAFLATTTFYINSLTSTYSISPAAITTDVNALKSRLDLEGLFEDHGLSKGAIAGISVGGTLAFFCLVGFFTYLLLRKRKSNRFENIINTKDDYDIERDHLEFPSDANDNVFEDNRSISKPAPPIPNRDKKPQICFPDEISEDDDLGLFDMKSTLSSIGNYDVKPPPMVLPKVRKNRGLNAINKLNHTIPDVPSTPVSRMACDRTMGVLYESPNEHPVWDEYDTDKVPGLLLNDTMTSPIRSSSQKDNNHTVNNDSDNEDYDFFKNSIHVPRVRSGSGATRYEYLSSNVESFKQELRLSSPLKTCFDVDDITITSPKNQPPPVPAPRKCAK